MKNLEGHNFETFLRESLENYEAPYSADWNEMEKRLDNFDGANPSNGNNRIIKSPLAKTIAGITVIGLGVFLLISLLSEDKQLIESSSADKKQSIIDKLRSNKSNRSSYSRSVKQNYLSKEGLEEKANNQQGIVSKNQNEQVTKDAINREEKNTKIPSKGIEQVQTITAEGPTLDMLRREYADVKTLPAPIATFSASKIVGCIPVFVHFELEKKDVAVSYIWDFDDGYYSTEANPTHQFVLPGRYNVSLTSMSLINQNLKTKSKTQLITVYNRPDIKFNWDNSENSLAYTEVQFIDKSEDVIGWSWDFGDNHFSNVKNPSHSYANEGSYIVKLIGENTHGCIDTVASQIRILSNTLSNKFFVPNAFTPNGDGSNDEFRPIIFGNESLDFEMSIYDRNGNLIYETDDINLPWDGRREDGQIAPTGTYIWLAILKNSYGKQEKQIGQVTLIQ